MSDYTCRKCFAMGDGRSFTNPESGLCDNCQPEELDAVFNREDFSVTINTGDGEILVTFYRGEADGVPVVQIDTTPDSGRIRVNVNDAPVFDQDADEPSRIDSTLTAEQSDLATYFNAFTGGPGHEHDWQLEEGGYLRTWATTLDAEAKTVIAEYSGSEDWSEEGDGKMYLQCLGCMATRPVPSDWEIDYQ